MKLAFSVRSLSKVYQMGEEKVVALDGVNFEVPEGDYVAIMGPSGSGKSTLLNLLGCLDHPTSGKYELSQTAVEVLNDQELSSLRAKSIGFPVLGKLASLGRILLKTAFPFWAE
jgi:putative ABC transport system ATP-binding protein